MDEELKKIVENIAGDSLEGFSPSRDGILDAFIKKEKIVETILRLRKEAGFDFLIDLFGIDRRPHANHLEVVYHLLRTRDTNRLRIRARVSFEDPIISSLTPHWPGANWFERECYDMFGIVFKGHPDLRRILMWEGFDGWPLRKDFPLRGKLPREKRYSRSDPKSRDWEA